MRSQVRVSRKRARRTGALAVIAQLTFAGSVYAQIDWSKAQTLSVAMVDDKFVPDHLTLRHGVPYRLHLENRGKDLHEFTAPEFLAAATVRDRSVLANAGKEIVVQPGKAADVELVPLRAGRYRLICADHDWDGMVGDIVVE